MNTLRTKIKTRLDALTTAMDAQKHLSDGEDFIEVITLIESITKFWTILSDAERDYINAVRLAVQDQVPWK
jgi:hypothetical protein